MKQKLFLVVMTFILRSVAIANPTVVLETESQLIEVMKGYSAAILFFGHGSKSQFANTEDVLSKVDRVTQELNSIYGKGRWVAVFGGDSYNPEKPDIGAVMKHLKESSKAPILAIQSDVVIQWGGVDKHIDYVHYVPTTQIPELGLDDKQIISEGKPKMKIVWGGFVNGKPAGPTAVYLGAKLVSGADPLIKGVISIGGGPIALEEVKYASKKGIPVKYIKAEARFPEVNGKYGPIDEWLNSTKKNRKFNNSCRSLFRA